MKEALSEKGRVVERVQLDWYTRLGVTLTQLAAINPGEADVPPYFQLFNARFALDTLAEERNSNLQLRVSRPVVRELLKRIVQVLDSTTAAEVYNDQKYMISHHAKQLEVILSGELGVQNCYLVRPKRAYDVELLAEDALKLFSEEVRIGLSDLEQYDLRQAGRCLAFEVPTAALFHIFRAADSVLRRWFKQVTNSEPAPKMRNWGVYIREIRKCDVDEKIVSVLEQLKDLHRNPVVHPEVAATIDDALSFVGIAESAISAMVRDIHARRVEGASALLWDGVTDFLPPSQEGALASLLAGRSGEQPE